MFMYRLGKDLGLRIPEVMEMSEAEFLGWAAFYKYESEETKKMMNKRSR
jgi:hypothetical protein